MSKGIAVNIPVFSFCVFHEGENHQSMLYICHDTEIRLVLWVWLTALTVFFLWSRHRKKCREQFLIILLAVLHTLLQEKATLLYFCEFPHNAFFLFGMQN